MLAIAKPQRNIVAARLATLLALRGRVNSRNRARYGQYSERPSARQVQQPFPWLDDPAQLIQSAVPATPELRAAQEASFLPPSGKQTLGLDQFDNGGASRPARGVEIRARAGGDVTQKGASLAAGKQPPATPALKREQSDLTRLAHASKPMQAARADRPTGGR